RREDRGLAVKRGGGSRQGGGRGAGARRSRAAQGAVYLGGRNQVIGNSASRGGEDDASATSRRRQIPASPRQAARVDQSDLCARRKHRAGLLAGRRPRHAQGRDQIHFAVDHVRDRRQATDRKSVV